MYTFNVQMERLKNAFIPQNESSYNQTNLICQSPHSSILVKICQAKKDSIHLKEKKRKKNTIGNTFTLSSVSVRQLSKL